MVLESPFIAVRWDAEITILNQESRARKIFHHGGGWLASGNGGFLLFTVHPNATSIMRLNFEADNRGDTVVGGNFEVQKMSEDMKNGEIWFHLELEIDISIGPVATWSSYKFTRVHCDPIIEHFLHGAPLNSNTNRTLCSS